MISLEQIRLGERRALSKAITLFESSKPADRSQVWRLLPELEKAAGKALRVGITGVPGVGKSTFIEQFGMHLLDLGFKVAVLAIDPSSQISGGSILGDKVRMPQLAAHPNAYIRPSPTSGNLGGVAQRTRDCSLLLDVAGFNVILIETVGVGQSEVELATMVDFFLMLLLPNAGDELQGIKRGIMEMAHGFVVHKADDPLNKDVLRTIKEVRSALHYMRLKEGRPAPQVLPVSSIVPSGHAGIWQFITKYIDTLKKNGDFDQQRHVQNQFWHARHVKEALDFEIVHRLGVSRIEDYVSRLNPTQSIEQQAKQIIVDLGGSG